MGASESQEPRDSNPSASKPTASTGAPPPPLRDGTAMQPLILFTSSGSNAGVGGSSSTSAPPGNLPLTPAGGGGVSQPSTPLLRQVGLDNYGNTCYCNSVIQLLFACTSLRNYMLEVAAKLNGKEDTILSQFATLVSSIHRATLKPKKKSSRETTVLGPAPFVDKVKKENIIFRNLQQQDAHEFAMFVLNGLVDIERQQRSVQLANGGSPSPPHSASSPTPIQLMFEGSFVTETTCMDCETVTTRTEPFMDLSLDIAMGASLRRCIENFSAPEFLMGTDKFQCVACCAPSPARRCMHIQRAPQSALLVHLKRFKYQEAQQTFKKLSSHVALPNEMVLHTKEEGDVYFSLKGFVVHQGMGPNQGHYFTIVRQPAASVSGSPTSPLTWLRLDDDVVTALPERQAQQYFGLPSPSEGMISSTAYILLYERS